MAHPNLSTEVRNQLHKHAGAFLLGNTAPDVQVISGQARQATHFFTLPIQSAAAPPWEAMLLEHPELMYVEHFPGSRSAFLAGYLCHLQADWIWVLTLFLPTFGPEQTWETFPRRLYLHNVLRAYLDEQVIPTLTADVVGITILTIGGIFSRTSLSRERKSRQLICSHLGRESIRRNFTHWSSLKLTWSRRFSNAYRELP
jgi:hypothetical protein